MELPVPFSRRFWTRMLARGLAKMPDRRGVKLLLRVHDRLFYYTLGVIKLTEGGLHPKHRVTDLHAFFVGEVAPGDRVLDVGCAYGQIATALASKAARVTALDVRPEAIARARAEHVRSNLTFVVGEFATFPTAERYDVIVLSNVLEHVRDRSTFLGKCRALGSKLLVRVPAIDRDWGVPYRRELGLEWRLHPDHEVEYTEESLRAELDAAQFVVERCTARYGALHCVAVSR